MINRRDFLKLSGAGIASLGLPNLSGAITMPYKTNAIAPIWTKTGNKAGFMPFGTVLDVGGSRTIRGRSVVEIKSSSYAGKFVEPRYLSEYAEPPPKQSPVTVVSTQAEFDALMNNASIPPGSIIVMQGNFTGNKVPKFAGTPAQPIQIIGSGFHLDGSIAINTPYTHWQNLSITAPADVYTFYTSGEGTELSYSDLGGGYIGLGWFGSGAGVVRNCTIHDTTSYGMYAHNHMGGLRVLLNNTFTNIGGYYGMHFYSDANRIRDYVVTGNTVAKPVIVHSGVEISNVSFIGNNFQSWLKLGNGMSIADTRQIIVARNIFTGVQSGLSIWSVSDLEVVDNTFDIIGLPIQDTNIYLQPGQNQKRILFDGNRYIGGDFNLQDHLLTFAEWQAAGYDPHGIYTE